ncbi:MAG TPA: FtsX-like permease family protein [Syntrophomonadaceae bacterium]|nr:FtsX-like permease family protein [Syntrophomonadaceae bacterium]
MGILNRRLFRLISNSRGQFIALSLVVTMGILIYISMTTAYYNLSQAQQDFYQKTRFADYYFQVVKAPLSVANQIQALPGVMKAEGRIQTDLTFIKKNGGRGTLRLTSYNLPMSGEMNQLVLQKGRMFSSDNAQGIEVLVDPQFAKANGLEQGGTIQVIAGGKELPLQVVGSAASPEFIYLMKDSASLLPDPENFGVIMMSYSAAERILNMQGQVNQVIVQLNPGTREEEIKGAGQDLLHSYGNLAAYPRSKQLSDAVVKAELDGLKVSAKFLPFLFLLIAAGIQFMLLGRMIRAQRTSIGIMKALGYSNWTVISHYLSYALAVCLVGAIAGCFLGVGLASVISQVYALYFNLPGEIGGFNPSVIIYSILISLSVGTTAGLLACRAVIRIQPAEAMRNQAPVKGGAVWLEKLTILWQAFNSSWRMSLRSMIRNRTRLAVTVLGVIGTVVLLVIAAFSNDAVDYMMTRHFLLENRYDYLVQFTTPIRQSELFYWQQWPELRGMEPVLDVPVAVTAQEQSGAGQKEENDVLQGLQLREQMTGVFDEEGGPLEIPEEGVLLNQKTAKKLGVQVGDSIWVETRLNTGPTHRWELRVVGVNQPLMGGGSYVSLKTANRLLGESGLVSRLLVKVEPGQGEAFSARLKDMTNVSSIVSRAEEKAGYEKMMESNVFSIGLMIVFAGILGMAIVYNASLMNFNERQRELASLRVLGYTRREVSLLLFKETGVQALLGIIIGLPLGRWISKAYVASASTDFYSIPFIIYPRTYALAALGAAVFAVAGYLLILPRLGKIDMAAALKNTD